MGYYQHHFLICTNQKENNKKCCAQSDAATAFEYAKQKVASLNLQGPGKIRVSRTGCLGRCAEGPCVAVYPQGNWYRYQNLEELDLILKHYTEETLLPSHLKMDND